MVSSSIQVKDIAQIDLERHAVIEASAGTGKTYCIENLVVRLLCEKDVPLDKILLVTFTEKATGDLHARIRTNIIQALNSGVGRRSVLMQALESFDTASIFTIHGFCQRMLRQYAFENGGNFQMEMVSDDDLYPSLLRVQQRDEWQSEYGDSLAVLLQLSGYPGTVDNDGVSSWEKRVLELAKRYNPHAGDTLLPNPTVMGSVNDADALVSAELDDLLARLGPDSLQGDPPELIKRFQSLPMHASTMAACINKVLVPLLECLDKHSDSPATAVTLKQLIDRCAAYSRFSEDGFACLVNGVYDNKVTESTQAALDDFRGVATLLDAMVERTGVTGMKEWLAARTISRLVEMAGDYKLEHGLISFDDMLKMMADALNPDKNPRAAQMLKQARKRYHYALVDEFQDTDPVQWDIFKRIFLGSPDHRLFLIGDPKQAIYSFRGADVYTYIQAREEMLNGHEARCYNLPVNWRSGEGLVNALNKLCGSAAWFSTRTDDTHIPFQPVEVPPSEERRHQVFVDRTSRAPLSVVELNRPDRSPANARKWMAKFVAEEIERLIGDAAIVYGREGASRRLDYGGVCILVARRSEAAPLEELFIAKGIPYTFYKQGGLYESPEANHLYFLFKAIADPADTAAVRGALLTAAFRAEPSELLDMHELPANHDAKRLLSYWHDLATDRDWPEFFRSVIEDSRLLSGETANRHGERKMCNYRHILQDLHVAAEKGNLDFQDVLEIVRDYKEHVAWLPDNADTHRQASEEPKVQIMTIHSSKGLEFPVVFLAGGFTSLPPSDYLEFHSEDGNRVYDLIKSAENRDAWAAEQTEEDLRLFYVALTRAIFKLYIPRFRPEQLRFAGPVSHFLYSAIDDAYDRSDTADVRHIDTDGRDLLSSQAVPDYIVDSSYLADDSTVSLVRLPPQLDFDLPDLSSRMRVVTSFSALNSHGDSKTETDLLELARQFDEDTEPVDEMFTWRETVETAADNELPPGAQTGSMLHDVFETIDFSQVKVAPDPEHLLSPGSETLWSIDQALDRFPLPETLLPQVQRRLIAEIVYNTLTCPMFDDGFVLADLDEADRLHEMEFMFPAVQGMDVPDTQYRDGYLVGFVDLIFRYKGMYYILDWKSNSLKDGYELDSLNACMDEAGYHLQYRIYSIAVCRWLAAAVPGFDPGLHFGGVFYLFLRGLRNGDASAGVFRHEPSSMTEFVNWRRELADYFQV